MIANANDAGTIFVWSLVLMAAVVAGFLLVALVKKRFRASDEPPAAGFSLADLRELHRKGQLTSEEFERARTQMTASMRAATTRQDQRPDGVDNR